MPFHGDIGHIHTDIQRSYGKKMEHGQYRLQLETIVQLGVLNRFILVMFSMTTKSEFNPKIDFFKEEMEIRQLISA